MGYSTVLTGKQTFSTVLGAVYVPSILHMLQVSVRRRIMDKGNYEFKTSPVGQ